MDTQHEHPRRSSLLGGMSPKGSYVFGLITGIGAMSLVGFAFLAIVTLGGDDAGTKKAATTNTNTGTVAGAATNQATGPASILDTSGNYAAVRKVSSDDHVYGETKNATLEIIEYTDFQCPFCQRAHPTVKQLLDAYKGKIQLVIRNFPLDSIHPNARPAAIAAECVAEQKGNDGYWKFIDAMFAEQSKLGTDFYKTTAVGLGVDGSKFDTCLTSGEAADRVQKDQDEGTAAGVSGTPAFFINGKLVSGAYPFNDLKAYIDSIL